MGVLYRLEHDTLQHTIRVRDDVCSDENGADISWNPNLATVDTSGNHISPALSLLHEEGHVLEPAATRAQLEDAPSVKFDNLEEQRNITGVEHRAATTLGEGQRTSHEGTNYWVPSVSSRERDPEMNRRRALPNCNVDYIGGNGVTRQEHHAPTTKRVRSR